jgi:4'-phosphopantetheinyl transferase EntD
MSGLIDRVLAPGLWGTEIHDTGQDVPLAPTEAGLVAGAAAKRQRDFVLGRACAHAALAQAGAVDAVLLRADNGGALWPQGFLGSITHTAGYAAALVARDCAGIGIDVEQIGGVTETLSPRLFDEQERTWLDGLAPNWLPLARALLFSAKEAAFKARNAPAGTALVFRDMQIEVQGLARGEGRFIVRRKGAPDAQGVFASDGRRVLTALTLPR